MAKNKKVLQKYNPKLAIKGLLHAFCEQGMVHSLWTLYDAEYEQPDGMRTHKGLCVLEKGDLLTVFNDESRKTVKWQGVIDFDRKTLGGAGIQKGFEKQGDWISMFMREYPAELVRAKDVPKIKEAQQDSINRHGALRKYLKRGRG